MSRNSDANQHTEYRNMVKKWETIVAQPLSDEEKQGKCLSLLREHIDKMALSCVHGPNPAFQFYSGMLVLKQFLNPTFARGEVAHLAIYPGYKLVHDWIKSNEQGIADP